jgi:hypothetical protein
MEDAITAAVKATAAETDAVIAFVQVMTLEVAVLVVPQRLVNTQIFFASARSAIPILVSAEHE